MSKLSDSCDNQLVLVTYKIYSLFHNDFEGFRVFDYFDFFNFKLSPRKPKKKKKIDVTISLLLLSLIKLIRIQEKEKLKIPFQDSSSNPELDNIEIVHLIKKEIRRNSSPMIT